MNYLKLIRLPNLIIVVLAQVLLKYGLLEPYNAETILTNFQFFLLVFATLCIAAAGNVINDIYDVDIDKINKPHKVIVGKRVSEKAAYNLFIALNILGVAAGFYVSNAIEKPGFAAIFIFVSGALYIYASYLKGMILIGNIVVSILVALSLVIVGLFELLPAITAVNQESQRDVFGIILEYALFAFYLNLMREIVKDLQDINGDKNGDMNTLPIVIGRNRSITLVIMLAIIAIAGIIYYVYIKLYLHQVAILYFLFLIVAPLIFFLIKAWGAYAENQKEVKDYGLLSNILKGIMVLGICSLLLYKYILLP